MLLRWIYQLRKSQERGRKGSVWDWQCLLSDAKVMGAFEPGGTCWGHFQVGPCEGLKMLQ